MPDGPYLIEPLDRAKDDIQRLDEEARNLWLAVKKHLSSDPTPTISLSEPQYTSGPPLLIYRDIGPERVVVVEYKKYDKVLQILSVKVIPHQRERPTR